MSTEIRRPITFIRRDSLRAVWLGPRDGEDGGEEEPEGPTVTPTSAPSTPQRATATKSGRKTKAR